MVLPTQIRLISFVPIREKIYLGSLLFLAILFSSCKNKISDIRAVTETQNLPVQVTYNASYILSEKGKVTNKLTAAQIEQFQGEKEYTLATGGVQVLFYDSLEQEEARLSARWGAHYPDEKKLVAKDSVVLTSRKGERLETEELIFLEDSSKIYSDKFVKITTENGSILYGNGLVSNDSFTKWQILKPHDGQLIINEENE